MKLFIRYLNHKTSKLLMPVLTLAVAFSLVLVAIGSWNVWQISRGFQSAIPADIELQRLSGTIIHFDEVLTMSARMAAATGDLKWEDRYLKFEPKLDKAIKRAIMLAPEAKTDGQHAAQTDAANIALVEMEQQAFEWVRQGQTEQALALLLSPAYDQQKVIYAEGIDKTTDALKQHVRLSLASYQTTLSRSSLFSLISFLILAIAWFMILILVRQYIHSRQQAEKRLWAARIELEDSHARLQQSEAELRHKAEDLEETLHQLQQTQVKMVQSEKMSSLGHLVAGIAHEINNPVSFIYGNLQYLQETVGTLLTILGLYQKYYPDPSPEVKQQIINVDLEFLQADLPKLLNSMNVGTDRIHEIVSSLRNFSRTDETGCKSVNIHEGIDSTLLILQSRLKASPDRDEIQVFKCYGNLPLVDCYVGPLNQVFMNLLSNAIDAIDEVDYQGEQGKVPYRKQIMIRTSVVDAKWVQIAIADNGKGMSKTIRQKIFEPFFTTKPVGKGTGMGMPISYQIVVERHGGKLDCFSAPDRGTEFTIQIPIHQLTPPQDMCEARECTHHQSSQPIVAPA